MPTRKPPIRHKVKRHKREGRLVKEFERGSGVRRNQRSRVVGKLEKDVKTRKFVPEIDVTRPPKRKPSGMSRRAYERLLRRWRPKYSQMPLKELSPHIVKSILKEFGEEPDITIKSIDPESWEMYWRKVKGMRMSPKGFAAPPWFIYINPRYLGVLQTQDIDTTDDLGVPKLLVHEYLHTRSDAEAPVRFTEGFTDFLALRFVCKYFDVSKKVKDKIAQNDFFVSPYIDKVRNVQRIALMAKGGNKDKALKWIRDMYFYRGDITNSIYQSLKGAGIDEEDAEYLAKKDKLHSGKFWRITEKYGYESNPKLIGHRLGEVV